MSIKNKLNKYLKEKYTSDISNNYNKYYEIFDPSDKCVYDFLSDLTNKELNGKAQSLLIRFIDNYTKFYSEYDVELIKSIISKLERLDIQEKNTKEIKQQEYKNLLESKITSYNEELAKTL